MEKGDLGKKEGVFSAEKQHVQRSQGRKKTSIWNELRKQGGGRGMKQGRQFKEALGTPVLWILFQRPQETPEGI